MNSNRKTWSGETFQKQTAKAAELALMALTTDGAHHKQWYLEQILRALGIDPNHFAAETGERFEPGVQP